MYCNPLRYYSCYSIYLYCNCVKLGILPSCPVVVWRNSLSYFISYNCIVFVCISNQANIKYFIGRLNYSVCFYYTFFVCISNQANIKYFKGRLNYSVCFDYTFFQTSKSSSLPRLPEDIFKKLDIVHL